GFCPVESEHAHVAQHACRTIEICAPERIAGVFEHGDSPASRRGANAMHLGKVAVEIDCQNNTRTRCNASSERVGGKTPCLLVDVCKYGRGAEIADGLQGTGGHNLRYDDLVSG